VTNETEDKTGGEAQDEDDAEHDRPTAAPPFDPVAFAQEVLGAKPSPSHGTPAVRVPSAPPVVAPQPTPPPANFPASEESLWPAKGRAPMPTLTDAGELEDARLRSLGSNPPAQKRRTPVGLLSLANARVPSNLPPRARSLPSSDNFSAVDRGWEELATSPPPPLQQELIDSFTGLEPPPSEPELPPSTKDAPEVSAAVAASASAMRSVTPVDPTPQEMNDRVSLGDYTGALEIAERLLAIDPDDAVVKSCAESCRTVLRQMYITRIGPLERVPVVMVARDQMRWLSIDHRAGFVLSLVDGVSSLEMILDVSGMPELDTLRILSELAQQRIISFR
jgi:hypothetical protein